MTKAATLRKPAVSHIQRKLIPSYIFLTIMSILSVFPLYWMFTAATNTSLEVAQGKVWFGSYLAENYKNLIALRKHHPAFRLANADLVRKHLEFLDAPTGIVAYRLKNYAGRDDWRDIIVILNANKTATEVSIPEGTYTIVCCNGQINEQGLGTLQDSKATVSPQSALILCR